MYASRPVPAPSRRGSNEIKWLQSSPHLGHAVTHTHVLHAHAHAHTHTHKAIYTGIYEKWSINMSSPNQAQCIQSSNVHKTPLATGLSPNSTIYSTTRGADKASDSFRKPSIFGCMQFTDIVVRLPYMVIGWRNLKETVTTS